MFWKDGINPELFGCFSVIFSEPILHNLTFLNLLETIFILLGQIFDNKVDINKLDLNCTEVNSWKTIVGPILSPGIFKYPSFLIHSIKHDSMTLNSILNFLVNVTLSVDLFLPFFPTLFWKSKSAYNRTFFRF